VDGQAVNRRCADDEVCRDSACVLVNPPDSGPGCLAGCAGSTTVRRCVAGVAQDTACPLLQVCSFGNCEPEPPADGGLVTSDAGACVNACLDGQTLRTCSGGVVLTVTCNADSPCQDGRCTPASDPTTGGNCGCTGLSSLGMLVVTGLVVRRPRRRHV
jgi:uncharacterized protein (TIGR03382 family)